MMGVDQVGNGWWYGGEADCDDDGNYDDYEENENPLETKIGDDGGGDSEGNNDEAAAEDLVVEENYKGVDEVGRIGEPGEGTEGGQR